jgi:hypothetical protein
MHFSKVIYQKTFNLGNYQSEKIGVEMEINQGEPASKALDICKQLVEEYHIQNLPKETIVDVEQEPILVGKQSREDLIASNRQHILSCNSLEDLKTWEFLTKVYPELKNDYAAKLITLK